MADLTPGAQPTMSTVGSLPVSEISLS